MAMCKRCRALIARASLAGTERAKARGVKVGRKRKEVSEQDLDRVRSGEMTATQLATRIGVGAMTIRRRLRGK
jgi:DNA invertase Pin-like site-specific DNA recombinase